MDNRRRLALFLALMICMGTVYCFARYKEKEDIEKTATAASMLYDRFIDFSFDGIEYETAGNHVLLYEYVEPDPSSSVLERKQTAQIALDTNEAEAMRRFKNIRRLRDGLFFAASINWNGDWSGVCISGSALPSVLVDYADHQIKPGHYWLLEVPLHLLRDDL